MFAAISLIEDGHGAPCFHNHGNESPSGSSLIGFAAFDLAVAFPSDPVVASLCSGWAP